MAELVDALASGASVRKNVEVQVLLSAPIKKDDDMFRLFFYDIKPFSQKKTRYSNR